MVSYAGRHATYYDIFYADKPYAQEAEFVHQCLRHFQRGETRKILDLACGTGTHAIILEGLGYNVIGVDHSGDMLARAREKAEKSSSDVVFLLQDMRALEFPGETLDAVICLFDSLGYVESNSAIADVLRGVHNLLRPDGLFLFEFWHAGAMLTSYEPVRVRRWPTAYGDLLRIGETKLDVARQLAQVTYTIYDLHHDGTYSQMSETQSNRYFLVQEMDAFLSSAGFCPEKWFDGFSTQEIIDRSTWHVLAVTRRG